MIIIFVIVFVLVQILPLSMQFRTLFACVHVDNDEHEFDLFDGIVRISSMFIDHWKSTKMRFIVWCNEKIFRIQVWRHKKNHANLMYYISTPVTSHKRHQNTHTLLYLYMRNLKHFGFWFKTDSSPFFSSTLSPAFIDASFSLFIYQNVLHVNQLIRKYLHISYLS